MPRPFPVPFNIGTDICYIPRIFNILKGGNGRRFIRRVLNDRERVEGLERLDGPVERWRRAVRAGIVLDWKREELGLGLKELNRRRHKALGLGLEFGKKTTLQETEELRRELERQVRAEEIIAIQREELEESERKGVLDEESTGNFAAEERMDSEMEARLEEMESRKKEAEVDKDTSHTDTKKKRLEDADIMIRLMDENEKELAIAEAGLRKAAEFMAGRFAAKEAAIKAHHYRKLTYHSIAIHKSPYADPKEGSQPPVAVILPESGEWEEADEVKISISHDTDYATAVCLAHERSRRVHPLKKKALLPRHLRRSASTGRVSETNREIFAQLEMDDLDPKGDVEDSTWRETINALEEKERMRAAISDPKRLVKVENLAEDVTEEDLLELFRGGSEKLKVHIAKTRDGKRRGYGLLSFGTSRDAVAGRRKLDGVLLKGNKITVRWMGDKIVRTRQLGMGGKAVLKGEFTGRWVGNE